MGKSSPSPPASPDYTGIARTQAQASNPNVNTPLGSQRVTWNGDIPTIDQTLSPEQQSLLSKYQGNQGQALDALGGYLRGLASQGSFNPQQTPMVSRIDYSDMQRAPQTVQPTGQLAGVNNAGNIQRSVAPEQLTTQIGDAGPIQRNIGDSGQIQGQLDYSHLTPLAGPQDFAAQGLQAQNAILARQEPLMDRQEQLQKTQLANQGIPIGSEAYNADMDQMARARTDAEQQAILSGNTLQQQLFGMGLQSRQQGQSEANSLGQFANQAQGQQFGQNLAGGQFANQAQQQQFGQNLSAADFSNQALQNQFGMNLASGQFANQAQGQQYGQNLSDAQFTNNAFNNQFNQNLQSGQYAQQGNRDYQTAMMQNAGLANQANQQQYNQAIGAYQLPAQMYGYLQGGGQVQMPQFQGFTAPNYTGAAQNQAGYNQNVYNQQVGAQNQQTQGLYGLGAGALSSVGTWGPWVASAFSDRRLKSNIQRIGTHPLGIGIYDYTIFGQRVRGVMADEVLQVKPELVAMQPSGYLAVNYGGL